MTSLITSSHDGPVRILTLARPDRRNALTPDMLDDLRAQVVAPSHARCLVLTGQGSTFCSGFDLTLCEADRDGNTMRRLLATLSSVVRALRSLPVPVVIAAQGGAIAGGCALLGGADVIVADRAAKFGYPVTRLGVSPAVSAPTLIRHIGPSHARRLQLDPTLIDAAEAHRLELVHHLVDQSNQVLPLSLSLASDLASKPPEAMAATRAWLAIVEDEAAGGLGFWADAALAASVALVGGAEEQRMLRAPAPSTKSRGS